METSWAKKHSRGFKSPRQGSWNFSERSNNSAAAVATNKENCLRNFWIRTGHRRDVFLRRTSVRSAALAAREKAAWNAPGAHTAHVHLWHSLAAIIFQWRRATLRWFIISPVAAPINFLKTAPALKDSIKSEIPGREHAGNNRNSTTSHLSRSVSPEFIYCYIFLVVIFNLDLRCWGGAKIFCGRAHKGHF